MNAQLLLELAFQRLGRLFTGLDLSAGKFPFEWQRLILRSLATQDFRAAHEQGGNYLLDQGACLAAKVFLRLLYPVGRVVRAFRPAYRAGIGTASNAALKRRTTRINRIRVLWNRSDATRPTVTRSSPGSCRPDLRSARPACAPHRRRRPVCGCKCRARPRLCPSPARARQSRSGSRRSTPDSRSEERRVGKEERSRWSP